jgi:cytidylate kinase
MEIDLEKLCDITNPLAFFLQLDECVAQMLLVDSGNYLKIMLAVEVNKRASRIKKRKKRRKIDKARKRSVQKRTIKS